MVRWDVDLLDDQPARLLFLRDLRPIERTPVAQDECWPRPRWPARPRSSSWRAPWTASASPAVLLLDLDAELAPAEQRCARDIHHPGRRLEWIAGRLAAKEPDSRSSLTPACR